MVEIGVDHGTIEEILGQQVAHVLDDRVLGHHRVDVLQDAQPDVDGEAEIDEASHDVGAVVGSDDHFVDLMTLDDGGHLFHETENG